MSHEFRIERTTELEATPEQAWDAVNTAEGLASWLFPTGGEGGPAGEGDVWGGHRVVQWDPPRHSVVRMEGEDGSLINQLEYTFEQQGDGTLLLRYVHSGVLQGDDWETQYDGANLHTDFYQHTLAQYVQHFAGRHAAYVGVDGPEASSATGSFQRVLGALGLGRDGAAVGDRVRLEVDGTGVVDGVVDFLTEHFVGIRTEDALYRFFGRDAFGAPVFAGHHLFADGVDVASHQAAWKRWLDGVLAPATVNA